MTLCKTSAGSHVQAVDGLLFLLCLKSEILGCLEKICMKNQLCLYDILTSLISSIPKQSAGTGGDGNKTARGRVGMHVAVILSPADL